MALMATSQGAMLVNCCFTAGEEQDPSIDPLSRDVLCAQMHSSSGWPARVGRRLVYRKVKWALRGKSYLLAFTA